MRAVLLAALVLSPLPAHASQAVVCIDPGHGGRQPGAVGPRRELEKTIALEVAKRLAAEVVRTLDARVVSTRDADVEVDLDERVRLANEARADVFISIHCNSMPHGFARRRVAGLETYFLSAEATGAHARTVAARENAEARKKVAKGDTLSVILEDLAKTEAHRDASKLAYAVHQRAVKDLGTTDRGVHQAPFVVLSGAQMPAILVEIGFISNAAEAKKLADPAFQDSVAKAIAAGLSGFFVQLGRKELLRTGVAEGAREPPAPPHEAGGEAR